MFDEIVGWILAILAIIWIALGISRTGAEDGDERYAGSFPATLIGILIVIGLFFAYTFLKYL